MQEESFEKNLLKSGFFLYKAAYSLFTTVDPIVKTEFRIRAHVKFLHVSFLLFCGRGSHCLRSPFSLLTPLLRPQESTAWDIFMVRLLWLELHAQYAHTEVYTMMRIGWLETLPAQKTSSTVISAKHFRFSAETFNATG